MLHSVDFLILSVIQMYAKRAINNDKIINELFSWCYSPVYRQVFEKDPYEYIQNIKKMIKENDVHFSLVYPSFQEKNNYIVVLSSGHETDLFLDDYGITELTASSPKKLRDIPTSDARSNWIETKVCVPRGYTISNSNCQWEGEVIDIVDYGEDSENKKGIYRLILSSSVPVSNGIPLKGGYCVVDQVKYTAVKHNSSSDTVSASIILGTSGNYESHYIFNQFIRYTIKASRKLLDAEGFQVSSVSYTEINPLSSSSPNALKFQSQFHLTGKAIDRWIFDETAQPNSIDIQSYPTRDFTENTTVLTNSEVEKERFDREVEAIIEV